MSEIDPKEPASDGRHVADYLGPDTDVLSPRFEGRGGVEREGLPPGYRMRADAHYVEQLTSRVPDAPMRHVSVDDIDDPDGAGPGDAGGLLPLVRSIAEHGVVQPLLVRRDGGRYRLIAGHKRLAAARAAAVSRVPCLVHQADDTQARALAEAADVRAGTEATTPTEVGGRVSAVVMAKLADTVATIQSSAAMLGNGGSSLAHRVAIDLVRAEAWRAAWQLRAMAILDQNHPWRFRPALLGPALARIRDGFAAECRLGGMSLTFGVTDWNASGKLDEEALVCGVTAAVMASAGLVGGAETPAITVVARQTENGTPMVEIAQDQASLPSGIAARFFDGTWTDRPGGALAALAATIAQAVAERHGGDAAFIGGDGRGGTIRLTFGSAVSPRR